MKFVILGATGNTGKVLVQQALDQGHEVKAIVRNPEKIDIKHSDLEVVEADIFSADALSSHMTTCDAVLSCLGPPLTFIRDVNLYSEPIKAVCTAMRNNGVRRLVCISRWYVEEKNSSHPWYMTIGKFVIRKIIEDAQRMETYLAESGDIDFTTLRPPCLSDEPLDGRELLAVAGEDYSPLMLTDLPRPHIANLMLQTVEQKLFVKQFVAVGLRK